MVEAWHADARGLPPGRQGLGMDRRGTTVLRGGQRADAAGVVRFRTIRPGGCPGRTPHGRRKAVLAGRETLTTQLVLPDEIRARIYARPARPATRRAP